MFQRTTAVNKILAMRKRIKVIKGGTGAGKTYGIVPVIADICAATPNMRATMTAETYPALRDGCIRLFKNIMQDTGRWNDARWRESPSYEYRFANGTVLEFRVYDSVGKAKAADKRDLLFINEANHIHFDIADALMTRSRQTYIDYNPDNEFWVDREILTRDDAELLTLTYADNEACPEETIADLNIKMQKAFFDPAASWDDPKNVKSTYWANWCRIYVRGEMGRLEGLVFSDWSIVEQLPPAAKFLGYGIDFGFTADPTAVMGYWYLDGAVYWDEMVYQTGLKNREIADLLKANGIKKQDIGVADSAEPKSISEINERGFTILPAEKGPDSIRFGIQQINEAHFYVTARSLNAIRELRGYVYEVDRSGAVTQTPVEANDHTIDPSRYFYTKRLKGLGKPKTWGKSKLV